MQEKTLEYARKKMTESGRAKLVKKTRHQTKSQVAELQVGNAEAQRQGHRMTSTAGEASRRTVERW